MPIQLVPNGTATTNKASDPISYQIYDLFECYFPELVQSHVRELNQSLPLLGLKPQIERGELSEGQWALYTVVSFSGQVMNGGIEGFLDNCPGLIVDVRAVIQRYASQEFLAAYMRAAEPFLDLFDEVPVDERTATGPALEPFWKKFEDAWNNVDEDALEPIDNQAYARDRDTDQNNWFRKLDAAVLMEVMSRPEQFVAG